MQVASLQAATGKLQQNISQLPEILQRGEIWRGLLSVNQRDVFQHWNLMGSYGLASVYQQNDEP